MKRQKHSLSNYKLFSCDMGELVPCGLTEVLPGDSFQHATSALVRVSPMLAPVMHPVHVRIHHWFVPHRLIWEDWEKFITGGPDGMDASVFPTISLTWAAGTPPTGSGVVGGLADYLGCPTGINNLEVSALPFRGYALIWNEWYRDQDLQTPLTVDLTSGVDTTTNTALQNVAWEKDYFTSARPWTQKGPEVTIPLQGNAPITGLGIKEAATLSTTDTQVRETNGSTPTYSNWYDASGQDGGVGRVLVRANDGGTTFPYVFADLSNVTAANINDLRLAFALQRYEEARARYGSRYTEYLRYLGV